MEEQKPIQAEKITKPIQLLAAWLVGLTVVNGSFLAAAAHITAPPWIPAALTVASIVNVPLFLISIFLLQTKFRPEMQEDSYYSQYLDRKTGYSKREVTAESVAQIREEVGRIEAKIGPIHVSTTNIRKVTEVSWSSVTVMLNKRLRNFSVLAKALSNNGIPVHELFGSKAPDPEPLKVALGAGFTIGQVRHLVKALSEVPGGWIYYAYDDDEVNQYANQVLIGAYGSYSHGIEISKAAALLSNDGITESDLYRMIGAEQEK